MALAARAPKPAEHVRHRDARSTAAIWTDVQKVPYDGPVPELPLRRPNWPIATLKWWGIITRMPHCILWDDADWESAVYTCKLHAAVEAALQDLANGVTPRGLGPLMTEYRRCCTDLGVTYSARLSLRIRYVDPVEKTILPESVAKLSDYSKLYD